MGLTSIIYMLDLVFSPLEIAEKDRGDIILKSFLISMMLTGDTNI